MAECCYTFGAAGVLPGFQSGLFAVEYPTNFHLASFADEVA